MVTKDQAKLLRHGAEIHAEGCTRHVGPRGGVTIKIDRFRVNGQFKEFGPKSPNAGDWRVPLKYGLKLFADITQSNCDTWHRAEDCPVGREPVSTVTTEFTFPAKVEKALDEPHDTIVIDSFPEYKGVVFIPISQPDDIVKVRNTLFDIFGE